MGEIVTVGEDKRFVIVTGMSGGGKTQACRFMEDLGFFCVDNLPPMFITKFMELSRQSGALSKVVIVVDTRSREFFDAFVQVLDTLDSDEFPYDLLFIDASDAAIIRRYKETRRPHPLAPAARLSEGVAKERKRLEPILQRATKIIDTSNLKKTELRSKIQQYFGDANSVMQISISVVSFGFKYGIPLDADMMLDVRFLPNPFYVDSLKQKSGTVSQVAAYIDSWDVTQEFKRRLDNLIEFLIPQYINEGKSQLVIAIGCTGGMHRSVFIAKHIYDLLNKQGYTARLEHRDLMKNDVREHQN